MEKKKPWPIIIGLLVVLLIFSLIIVIFISMIIIGKIEDQNRIQQLFGNYEKPCTEISNYIYNINPGKKLTYYIIYDDEGADSVIRLKNISDNSEYEIDDYQTTNFMELYEVFPKMTGGEGYPCYIWVSEEYVVYYSDGYEPELIYSVNGGIDSEMKKVEEKYREFYKINDNWYAIRINLL